MRTKLSVLMLLILSAAVSSLGATTAPVPTLTINRHPERRIPPPDPKAMEAATREVISSLTDFRRVANDLRMNFETSPEYTNALSAMLQARQKLEIARQQTLMAVKNSPEYVQQKIKIEKIEAELASLRKDGKDHELTAAASELLVERSKLSKMEADAIDADPSLAELKRDYVDSANILASLRDNFAQDLRTNTDWQQARATYADAVQRRASVR